MAPSSSAFGHLDRRRKGHYLPNLSSSSPSHPALNSSPSAASTDDGYPLELLDPRPDQTQAVYHDFAQSAFNKPASSATRTSDSIDSGHSDSFGYSMASSNQGQRSMFSVPPPPIAPSTILPSSSKSLQSDQMRPSFFSMSAPRSAALLFGQRRPTAAHAPTSGWTALQSKRQALEKQIQQLLDVQAAALAADSLGSSDSREGSHGGMPSPSGSTPRMGFPHSPTGSSSRMAKSLHVPPRSTPQGDVIPVRQPATPRIGLREAREGIQASMAFLSDIGHQEIAYMDTALADRKEALAQLTQLAEKQSNLHTELEEFDDDAQEPLAKELRELDAEHNHLNDEIKALEDKLVNMRRRRRSVKERMQQVKSQRESGLSGYHGALRDVETRISDILHRPPVQPLDMKVLCNGSNADADSTTLGGIEFIQLIPERRTVAMAQSWWETEIEALDRRISQLATEQQALKDGRTIWQQVSSLVNDYEANLRQTIKSAARWTEPSPLAKDTRTKASQPEMLRAQRTKVEKLIVQLEQQLQFVESQRWTLLICAIGAELEIFRQAHDLLGSMLGDAASGDEDLLSSPVANGKSSNDYSEDETTGPWSESAVPDVGSSPVDGHAGARAASSPQEQDGVGKTVFEGLAGHSESVGNS
ncbi:hypothetical protein CDD82_510 [Ophiocordyceps australis]|uniref:Autophagy-related protein 28 n=1 Tax=Ophiocordyceps australis TaxID=1399860 RepID=A0A2C5YG48_9HYPO|nr:hypothetical protein CDD82_510 [Ophiocordyceps australis]